MKRMFLVLALIALFAVMAFASSDAGFLETPITGWWCLHQDGTRWVFTAFGSETSYEDVVAWCAANGYSW